MMTKQTYRAGGYGRAAPRGRPGRWAGRLALVVLAVATLGIEGCASFGLGGGGGGCNSCGRPRCCGLRRLFSRPAVVESYEPGIGVGVPVEAPPPAVAAPPTVIQAPPPVGGEVPELTPAPEATTPSSPPPGGGNGGGAANPGPSAMLRPGRAVYHAQIDRARGGPTTARRDLSSRPGTTPRSPTQRNDVPPAADDPLADFSLRLGPTATPNAEGPAPEPAQKPEAQPVPDSEASEKAPAPTVAAPEAPAPAGVVSLTPGITCFKSVRPKLAGGSLPDATGWDWLGSKIGYKTVLDLRDPSEVRPEDLAAVNHQGLRYILLPIDAGSLDDAKVKRFLAEVDQAGDVPLFFFDKDGSKASVMWFLHRVLVEKDTREAAALEAEQVGPRSATLWAAAARYLDSLQPESPAISAPPAPDPNPNPVSNPLPTSAAVVPQVAVTPLSPDAPATPDDPSTIEPAPSEPSRPAAVDLPEPTEPADRLAWRPVAALLLTGLGIPLAYLGGRSAVNLSRRVRASLPAPAPQPRELPSGSGA